MRSRVLPPTAFPLALLVATLGVVSPGALAAPVLRDPTRGSPSPGEVILASSALSSGPVSGALVAAAGDIACDPKDSNFVRGRGRRGECKQRAVSNAIIDQGAQAVLVLGDSQYDEGRRKDYLRSYDRSWGRFKDITYPAVGNHEYWTPNARGYWGYFHRRAGERGLGWYSFDLGTWHLIALNSNCEIVRCTKGSREYRWLRSDLAASSSICTVAYMHHPRFSTGPHGDYNGVRPMWRLLYAAGVDLVLAGHDHTYQRFAPQAPDGSLDRENGIREFVSGVGGAETYWFESRDPQLQVREADALGVLFLRLGDGEYGWRFDRVRGDRFNDSGRGLCH